MTTDEIHESLAAVWGQFKINPTHFIVPTSVIRRSMTRRGYRRWRARTRAIEKISRR